MVEVKWTGSQSNRGAWACVTLLSKKSCALTNGYNFWPSGMHSILTIVIRAKVTNLIPGGQLLRGRLLRVAHLSRGGGHMGQVTI